MKELIKEIESVLLEFTKAEVGNRLSPFSMLALKEIILNNMKDYQLKEEGENKGKKVKAEK